MPLIPYSDFDPGTGLLPASNPASGLVNPFVSAYCSALPPVQNWLRDRLNGLQPGAGDIVNLPARAINGFLCPNQPPPGAILAPGIWPSGCDSFGMTRGYYQGLPNVFGVVPAPQFADRTWGCGEGFGLPIGAPFFGNIATGGAIYSWSVIMERADGSQFRHDLGFAGSDPDPSRYIVTQVDITPCPGCGVPPSLPPRPILPPRTPPGTPPPPPEFPITINIPQPPGFPSLDFPVIYAPITPTLNIDAPISFAPRFDVSPELSFAPKIELNLGGLSITGGGYPETIQDVIENCTGEGGECPDPCPPLDYNLIRQIAIEELDAKFPPSRPFTTKEINTLASGSRTFVLPEFTQSVDITIVIPPPNVRVQFGGELGVDVKYNGWYSFGALGSTSERIPLHYDFVSVKIPPGITGFTYTIYNGGTATTRIVYYDEGLD